MFELCELPNYVAFTVPMGSYTKLSSRQSVIEYRKRKGLEVVSMSIQSISQARVALSLCKNAKN